VEQEPKAFAKAARKAAPQPAAPAGHRAADRTSASPRLAEASARYGFDLPEEVLAVWDLASSLSPEDPCSAFDEIGLTLVGPFDLLAGRTRVKPGLDVRLHYRFRFDPPEFFTVAMGNVDRLHFGYWLDDPAEGPACVASYYASDAFELGVAGRTLGEALRAALERDHQGAMENLRYDPAEEDAYVRDLGRLGALRERLMAIATGDRAEIGEAYLARHSLATLRARYAVAPTPERMGVVAPADRYRAPSLTGEALRKALASKGKRAAIVAEGLRLSKRGFPASALALGRACWADGKDDEAYALLDAAYAGLGRTLLREVLALHREHRDLRSVDVLAE